MKTNQYPTRFIPGSLVSLLLKTSQITVALAVITGLISGLARAGLIALINNFVNHNQTSNSSVVWNFILFLVMILITGVVSQVLLVQLAEGTVLNLRLILSRQILASPLRQLEEIGSYRLLATLTDDIESISNTVNAIPFLCINIAIILGCLIYLGWLSLPLLLFLLIFLGLGTLSHQYLMIKAGHALEKSRHEQDRLFKHFRTITDGIKELKLHNQRRNAFFSENLQATALASRNHNFWGFTIFTIAVNWGLLLFFIAIGLIFFWLTPWLKVETATLSGYALTIIYLTAPLENIIRVLPILTKSNIALKKIKTLGLSLTSHLQENLDTPISQPIPNWKQLELVRLTHAYYREGEDRNFSIGPIDLTFKPGEIVFIVGGNGCGKSTLAKLIIGLYIPEGGNIILDGQIITDENREWYRQYFSVVFSDFFLFDSLLGLTGDNQKSQIQQYLAQLQLDKKVKIKDGEFSTIALSQGQRKRLALLTAYLEDRPIYLFDEWAADQDPIFKEIFYSQILQELKQRGKTVLVISHDDHYFNFADRIIKLDYGQVEYDKQIK